MIQTSLYKEVVPLNLDLGISKQLGWVSFVSTSPFMGFSLIPLDDFSTNSLFNPLVSGFAMLSFDFTWSTEITLVEINCLMVLCLQLMCLDLPLYIILCALPMAD